MQPSIWLCTCISVYIPYIVYDRIDAVAAINFSTQFGAATIRERCLFESAVYFIQRGYGLKRNSVKKLTLYKHKDSLLVLLRASGSGVQAHHQVLSGVRNI